MRSNLKKMSPDQLLSSLSLYSGAISDFLASLLSNALNVRHHNWSLELQRLLRFQQPKVLSVSTTQPISTHSVVVRIGPQKVSLIPLAVMQHWSRVVAWTMCNRLPRATNVCRLPALRETPQRHRGHPCGHGVCGGYSYSLQSRICGLQVWMGCASMLCDEFCEGEVFFVWSFMSQTSPRETWRFHEAWSIPDIHIESIPMICLIHSRKTRYLKRTQCLSQWFFPQWPVTSSGLRLLSDCG